MSDRLADELQRLREERDAGRDFMSDFMAGLEQISDAGEKIKGIFSSDELKSYNKHLGDIRRNLRYLHTDYRRISDEIKRMHEEMDDLGKKRVAFQQSSASSSPSGSGVSRTGSMSPDASDLKKTMDERRKEQVERNNKYKLAAGIALGGIKGYIYTRVMQGLNVRIGQEKAALDLEGGLGQRGLKSFGYRGIGLGMNPTDAMGALLQTGRAVGAVDKRGAYSNMLLSQGRNLSMGDLTGFQKAARFAGDRALGKALNDSLVNAFKASGSNPALMEEFLRSSTGVLQKMGGQSTSFRGSDAVSLLARASRSFGGVYQRSPERTAGLLGRLNAGMGEGGNDATMAFKLRAVGFGSGMGYWQAIEQIQRGATAKNINAYREQVRKEYGGMSMNDQIGAFMRLMGGNIKFHEARTVYTKGIQALDTTGAGVDADSLRSRIRGRTGDVRRKLSTDQQKANLAGSKSAQLALNKIANIERRFLEMLTKISNFLAARKPTASEVQKWYGGGGDKSGPATKGGKLKIIGRRRNKDGTTTIITPQGTFTASPNPGFPGSGK